MSRQLSIVWSFCVRSGCVWFVQGHNRIFTHKHLSSLSGLAERMHSMQAHSLSISIPHQLLGKAGVKQADLGGGSFIPPHQLSLHACSLPVTTSAQIRTRNRVFQSTGFLPQGTSLQQGFLVSRASTQPHIPEHSTELGTDELMHFNPPDLSPPASRAYTRRMSLPAQPSAQKHMPAAPCTEKLSLALALTAAALR